MGRRPHRTRHRRAHPRSGRGRVRRGADFAAAIGVCMTCGRFLARRETIVAPNGETIARDRHVRPTRCRATVATRPLLDPAAPAAVDTSLRTLAAPTLPSVSTWMGLRTGSEASALCPQVLCRAVSLSMSGCRGSSRSCASTARPPRSSCRDQPRLPSLTPLARSSPRATRSVTTAGSTNRSGALFPRTGKKRVDARPGGARSCARCPAFGLSLP